jgi:hypothetical protein
MTLHTLLFQDWQNLGLEERIPLGDRRNGDRDNYDGDANGQLHNPLLPQAEIYPNAN